MEATNNIKQDKMYNEPVITYNHMQEEARNRPAAERSRTGIRGNVVVRFIAEELIIALLLALIFYMI
jgi:hypothetical protein